MDRWYYLKKRFSIFPGFLRPVGPRFLDDYYAARRSSRSFARLILDGLVCLALRLWLPFRTRWVARRFELDRQWARHARALAARRFVDPHEIALFRLQSDADADDFMRRFEYAGISKRINPKAWRRDCVLADKVGFAERCVRHGLPSLPTLAWIKNGAVRALAAPDTPTIAIKPKAGMGGRGFELVRIPHDFSSPEAFALFLADRMTKARGEWIVQPRIFGHADLRDIAMEALPTARITTMRNEKGQPEIVAAALRFPAVPTAVVDNLAAGGLLAPIEIETGTLGDACHGRLPCDAPVHPSTGAAIAGRRLPFWAAAHELVLRAHRDAFGEYVMIGWDVGLAEEGPVLVEGNGKPGLFAAQRATRTGIGATRFGALVAFHLSSVHPARGAFLSRTGVFPGFPLRGPA